MAIDETLFLKRGNYRLTYGLKPKDAHLHRMICLKKIPSSELLLARAIQLSAFSQKLQSLAEALVDNGELSDVSGRAALRGVTEMMGVMHKHSINSFLAFEQSEALRSGAIIHEASEIDVSDD